MTVAVMSTAFTGQAIAVGFDRRYGALKRLGATPLPRWGVIAGKSIAVAVVVVLQAIVLGAIGVAFGWDIGPGGLLVGAVAIAIGTLTFSALGCSWAARSAPRSSSPSRTSPGSSSSASAASWSPGRCPRR